MQPARYLRIPGSSFMPAVNSFSISFSYTFQSFAEFSCQLQDRLLYADLIMLGDGVGR